jgi:hypothetical protein
VREGDGRRRAERRLGQRRKTTPGGQAGPNGRITQAGKEKFQEKEKKLMGRREFWAALRKKKKIFRF